MKLGDASILAWIYENSIKTEQGDPLDLKSHYFMVDIYKDFSPKQAWMKAAQVSASTCASLKSLWAAKTQNIDAIYTLPTEGDRNTFVGGKVNRLIAQNDILKELVKDKDSVEQKQIGDNIVHYRGCVDEQTEILTENGWRKFGFVGIGDKLPTLNILTNTVELDNVLDISCFMVDGDMVKIQSRQIDQLVTPDHRCVISKRTHTGEKSPLRISLADQLVGKTSAYVPMKHRQVGMKYGNVGDTAFYRILGWVIGDGSYWTKRDKSVFVRKDGTINPAVYESKKVCIIQSKFCAELEADLHSAQIGFFKKKHGKNCFRYELNSKASNAIREVIPSKELTYSLVFNATPFEREELYRGLMMSDGNNYKETAFYQNTGETVDAFQALLVLLGKTSSVSKTRKNVLVSIKTTDYAEVRASFVSYKGIAWCPTTRNGTIFIRRNGKVSVTGQTFTKKSATMVPSDLNVYDEIDASKQDVVEQYSTRLQHSKKKWEWYLSHPSATDFGVHKYWLLSDQKHWFIKCHSCQAEQYLSWPESIDAERQIFVCKECNEELSDEDRRVGRWVKKYKDKEYSGYWIPLLICPWVSAKEILGYYKDKSEEYFYNKVLGLPYVGSGNKLTWESFSKNLTGKYGSATKDEQIVIGIDTGLKIDYVMGGMNGLFYHATTDKYDELDKHMQDWPRAIAVIDAGGDLIGSRSFFERWAGRVFLCYTGGDRKTKELVRWGANDEYGNVVADRNRTIQMVVDEFGSGRIPVQGTSDDWVDYYNDWKNLTRTRILDPLTGETKGYKWIRSGRDHKALATVYWRVGMDKFGFGGAEILSSEPKLYAPAGPELRPDNTIQPVTIDGRDPVEQTLEQLRTGDTNDWRDW